MGAAVRVLTEMTEITACVFGQTGTRIQTYRWGKAVLDIIVLKYDGQAKGELMADTTAFQSVSSCLENKLTRLWI